METELRLTEEEMQQVLDSLHLSLVINKHMSNPSWEEVRRKRMCEDLIEKFAAALAPFDDWPMPS